VLTPERVVIAESRRTWTSLGLHGFVVDGVVVNRVFPGAGADPWRTAWNDAQQAGLREVRESFAGLPVAVAPYLPAEPVGPDALAGFAAALEGGQPVDDLLAPVAGGGLRVEPVDGGFALRLSLPLVTAGEVSLQRRGEELLLEVGGHRRVLALPSALQRCRVTGAAVRSGDLEIAFEPDEAVWRRG
jgi:arsenite-transporting ATPase